MIKIKTIGELKQSKYKPKSIKDELRDNLIVKLRNGEKRFTGILGFDETVLPDIERAILSRHNFLLLGLRGQAKTRIARKVIELLDEFIPIIQGSEINDDPLFPLSRFGKDLVAEMGDDTPIDWLHRSDRFIEKLATPDVSVADLVGDIDPIKAAALRLPYADERVLHFGLLPRANRCIFIINELPDLQPRIQVSLFNALQEGDIQIRGFKVRLPMDIQFIFTANPEDYTNRGSIITPLKDRIESQILTHYPESIDISKEITQQEARISDAQKSSIYVPDLLKTLIEEIAFEARDSDFVDENSGVSARLSISAFENLVSAAERRMLINGETNTSARISDFWGIIPAITGKIELVYEGEQEGPYEVALLLLGKAIKKQFLSHFPNPEKPKKNDKDHYGPMKAFFSDGNTIDLLLDTNNGAYEMTLESVPGLKRLVKKFEEKEELDLFAYMELALFGLTEFEQLSKELIDNKFTFQDSLSDMLSQILDEEEEDL
ncbi:MAG: sigma 54-interacting transcriptional regulator [Saprospiraceae bacterium]